MEFKNDFKKEIDAALRLGQEGFKKYIEQKLQLDEYYLERTFWIKDGAQITLLSYLIQEHQEIQDNKDNNSSNSDLTAYIEFVLSKKIDKNSGEPIHQALASGKLRLGHYLMNNHNFDVNRRDEEGRSLLAIVLSTKNRHLLKKILMNKPDINSINYMPNSRIPYQPLHQAIMLNFASGVICLGQSGADLSNPWGKLKETPVLMAARLGKIKALEALLDFPTEKLNLEAENVKVSSDNKSLKGDNAIESLCICLEQDQSNKDLLRGIAMLLCNGAQAPRKESMRQFLISKNGDLIKEIDGYLESRPHLVDSFVSRCHLAGSALHKILYTEDSWMSTLRQIFGKPSTTAVIIERLITRKDTCQLEKLAQNQLVPAEPAKPKNEVELQLKLYAEFVRRYNAAYENQRITNPWSTMRWMIAKGDCNWDAVQQYACTHPKSRTQIIYEDMIKELPKNGMNDQVENPDDMQQSSAVLN